MFIFLLQSRAFVLAESAVYLFAIFQIIVWAMWLLKVVISRRYEPATGVYKGTTAVLIPVVDEPLDLFADVLARITGQHPDQVIVVINGPRNVDLEQVCTDAGVMHLWTRVPGKRNAIREGMALVDADVTVLLDSDTLSEPDAIGELMRPFADPAVGGATTRQRILDPSRTFITRWADWLENSRSLYSFPAQSVLGQVGCLPGRMIAFRTHILRTVMHDFLTQRFLGIFLEVSDDRTLTNLTLRAGYRTVYQHTALVFTDAPLRLGKLAKQQLRWARGSQYNTLRMLPWMVGHAPVLAFLFTCDIVLPFLLIGAWGTWAYKAITHTGINLYQPLLEQSPGWAGWLVVAAFIIFSSWLSMTLRQLRHLNEVPGDLLRMPLFIIFSTLFLMPIRVWGFFRMAHVAGWGTRANSYTGADAAPAGGTVGTASAGKRTGIAAEPMLMGGRLVPATSASPPRTRRARRRLNPLAAVPYLIGGSMLVLMGVTAVA